jgi:hypothetical protein
MVRRFLLILLLLVMAGCMPIEIDSGTSFEMEIYMDTDVSGFSRQVIRINEDSMIYTLYDEFGGKHTEIMQDVAESRYQETIDVFRNNDFMGLQDANPMDPAEDRRAVIRAIGSNVLKAVEIDPYSLDDVSAGHRAVAEEMEKLIDEAREISIDEARVIAEEWIRGSPTYGHDGFDLSLVGQERLGPGRYGFTYSFNSRSAGYGNRSGQVVAQVITPHTIRVRIDDLRVTHAVIDGRWDDLKQQLIDHEELTFQPMQCVETPWEEWYSDEGAQFVAEPTDEELIISYYSTTHDSEIIGIDTVFPDVAVCTACEVCPRGYHYDIQVADDIGPFIEDGWETVQEG